MVSERISTAVLTKEPVGVIQGHAIGIGADAGKKTGAAATVPMMLGLTAGTTTTTIIMAADSGLDPGGEGPSELDDDAGEEGDNFAMHAVSSKRRWEKKRQRERRDGGGAGVSSLVDASKPTSTTLQRGSNGDTRSRRDDDVEFIEPMASARASPILMAGMSTAAMMLSARASTAAAARGATVPASGSAPRPVRPLASGIRADCWRAFPPVPSSRDIRGVHPSPPLRPLHSNGGFDMDSGRSALRSSGGNGEAQMMRPVGQPIGCKGEATGRTPDGATQQQPSVDLKPRESNLLPSGAAASLKPRGGEGDVTAGGGGFLTGAPAAGNFSGNLLQRAPPERQQGTGASTGPSYKYVEVVRGKAARDALDGVSCRQCAQFYAALRSWDGGDVTATGGREGGGGGNRMMPPSCGHVRSLADGSLGISGGGNQRHSAAGITPSVAASAGDGEDHHRHHNNNPGAPSREERLRQDASRHRFRRGNAPRPDTQPGFWDMAFEGDSSD